MPLFTPGGLGLGLKNSVLFTSLLLMSSAAGGVLLNMTLADSGGQSKTLWCLVHSDKWRRSLYRIYTPQRDTPH